jgi:hypothetical protein
LEGRIVSFDLPGRLEKQGKEAFTSRIYSASANRPASTPREWGDSALNVRSTANFISKPLDLWNPSLKSEQFYSVALLFGPALG